MTWAIPVALILAYPSLVHLAVWLEQPVIQILALLVLTLGLLLPGLLQGRRFTWGLFLVILVLFYVAGYLDIAIYLLYLPPVLIPLLLWAIFLHSLLPGQVPLVTSIAEQVRGTLSAQIRGYTRGVTLMWTVVFAAMTLLSVLLPWLATTMLWSLFTGFIYYLIIGLLFAAEFAYRKWRLQDYDHPRFVDYVKIVVNADIRKR